MNNPISLLLADLLIVFAIIFGVYAVPLLVFALEKM